MKIVIGQRWARRGLPPLVLEVTNVIGHLVYLSENGKPARPVGSAVLQTLYELRSTPMPPASREPPEPDHPSVPPLD